MKDGPRPSTMVVEECDDGHMSILLSIRHQPASPREGDLVVSNNPYGAPPPAGGASGYHTAPVYPQQPLAWVG